MMPLCTAAPTEIEAIVAHVLRGLGSRDCRRLRSKLKAGKKYPFRLQITGEIDGEGVSRWAAGWLVVEHDHTVESAPGAKQLLAGLLSLYGSAGRTRIMNRLAAVDFDTVDSALMKLVDELLARIKRPQPRTGSVKVEVTGDCHRGS